MSNRKYPKGREAFARGLVDWETDPLGVVAVDAGYTYSDAHDNLDDVAGGSRLFTFTPTGADATDGILDLADHTEPLVPLGDTIRGLVIFLDTGVEATSRLLVFIDERSDTTPLSIPTTGGNVEIVWPNGPNKITRL